MSLAAVITLTTDFGLTDHYVASMKGAILSVCDSIRIIDMSHLIQPHDIMAAGFILNAGFRDFPAGTIHVAVVDPGVGTQRRALAVQADGHTFVGPDNGIFSFILTRSANWEARELQNDQLWRANVSATFHGRDIFAPTAAHLACGTPFHEVGEVCKPMVFPWARATVTHDSLQGAVVHIDHFGNLITNISAEQLSRFASPQDCRIYIAGLEAIQLHKTFGDVDPGKLTALIGSSGYLEIAVNQGSAARQTKIRRGTLVRIGGIEIGSESL